MPTPHEINIGDFAKLNGRDESDAVQKCIDTAIKEGIGIIRVPDGQLMASAVAKAEYYRLPSFVGSPRSYWMAGKKNQFALAIVATTPGSLRSVAVRDLVFTSYDYNGLSHGLYVDVGAQLPIENCTFTNCAIGVTTNASYGVHFRACSISQNYLGALLTHRSQDNRLKLDELSLEVSLPETNNVNGPVDINFDQCNMTGNRVAVYHEQPDMPYQKGQRISFRSGVIQGAGLGVWVENPGIIANHNVCFDGGVHFEHVNLDGSATVNGKTVKNCDLYLNGGNVSVQDASLYSLRTDGPCYIQTNIGAPRVLDISSETVICCEASHDDDPREQTPAARQVISEVLLPSRTDQNAREGHGSCGRIVHRMGYSFANIDNAKLAHRCNDGHPFHEYGNVELEQVRGGTLDVATCLRVTTKTAGHGVYAVPGRMVKGKPTFVSFSVRSTVPVTVASTSVGAFVVAANKQWATYGICGYSSGDTGKLLFLTQRDAGKFDLSAVQVLQFDDMAECVAFQKSLAFVGVS